MKIISPDQLVITDVSQLKPFDRYVVADCEFDTLRDRTPRTNWTWSSFNSYERRYGGQDLNGKKICIYRHSAFGDQLMVSALPHYLKSRYPQATVHLYSHPSVHTLWMGNPWVEGSAISLPIPFDAMKSYDYHIFFEGMLEGNSEKDQSCCYDDMFDFCGCRDVPDSFKRPFIITRPEDSTLFNTMGLDKPYIVYHLSPANPNRMYPWKQGIEFINEFHRIYKDFCVVLVGQKQQATGDTIKVDTSDFYGAGEYPWFVDMTDRTQNFRELAPFIENAKAVVCPDSSVLHLAACYPAVPVFGLWGLFDSNDRAKYYTNHTPITARWRCPSSPCRNHNFELPKEQCSKAQLFDGKHCAALSGIQPFDIMLTIREKGMR